VQPFVQITIDLLDKHRAMSCTGQDVTINLKQIQRLAAYTKELAVFIQHDHVAKPYQRSIFIIAEAKVAADGFMTGSMQAKQVMPQQPIRYELDPSNPMCLPAA
jgi:hypothetical protein